MSNLQVLAEEIRLQYDKSSQLLLNCLNTDCSDFIIKPIYEECIQNRLKWNRIINTIQRIERDRQKCVIKHNLEQYEFLDILEDFSLEKKSWKNCSNDQIRVTAISLLSLLNEALLILDLRALSVNEANNLFTKKTSDLLHFQIIDEVKIHKI